MDSILIKFVYKMNLGDDINICENWSSNIEKFLNYFIGFKIVKEN